MRPLGALRAHTFLVDHAPPTSINHPTLFSGYGCPLSVSFEPLWLVVTPALCTEVCGVVRVDMRPGLCIWLAQMVSMRGSLVLVPHRRPAVVSI